MTSMERTMRQLCFIYCISGKVLWPRAEEQLAYMFVEMSEIWKLYVILIFQRDNEFHNGYCRRCYQTAFWLDRLLFIYSHVGTVHTDRRLFRLLGQERGLAGRIFAWGKRNEHAASCCVTCSQVSIQCYTFRNTSTTSNLIHSEVSSNLNSCKIWCRR